MLLSDIGIPGKELWGIWYKMSDDVYLIVFCHVLKISSGLLLLCHGRIIIEIINVMLWTINIMTFVVIIVWWVYEMKCNELWEHMSLEMLVGEVSGIMSWRVELFISVSYADINLILIFNFWFW